MRLTARHSLLVIWVSIAVLGGITAMFVFQPESELRDCYIATADKQLSVPAEFTYNIKGVPVDQVS
jgi:hypothetical protein